MRLTSPETKRRYQLGMVEQVREAMERANQQRVRRERFNQLNAKADKGGSLTD